MKKEMSYLVNYLIGIKILSNGEIFRFQIEIPSAEQTFPFKVPRF